MSDNLTDAEIIERLEAGLLRMPKLRREIFLAIRLDDASYVEIAERTGLSVEQVERHFAECLFALRQSLDRQPQTPRGRRILRRFVAKLRQ
ncbi:RNA polymerase subunit sigma [Sphingomonas sp. R647]|jgi:RNA polymerase sigma-70 factor (ECF subfamily)|uniref:RNA polymerase sigma factor n=1 Tax=Sphingomonas sp. R647 TaxID=2875233 RepID=UPI001CD1D371|nr:sigma factor-like helix-turn-helix DNA-binding protein [Sphingomonas sp. R647]MCA1199215.1 RNA polymerase subunit sigma [Sphingomonas sp. R647]